MNHSWWRDFRKVRFEIDKIREVCVCSSFVAKEDHAIREMMT